jgi:predicted regulator of Ras-like GTPase activity (Roadblock/LC7/MglB family)
MEPIEMNASTADVQSIVNSLSAIDGARAGLIIMRDGTPVADLVTGEEDEILGALTSAIFAAINKAMQRTGLGELEDVMISASNGSIQALAAGDFILIVVAEHHSNIGLIRLEMRRAARRITGVEEQTHSG